MGLKRKKFHLGAFDYEVEVILGTTQQATKYLNEKFRWNFQLEDSRGFTAYAKGVIPTIWLPKKPTTPDEIGTLAHEVLHATKHVMRWAGIPMSGKTIEAWCHLEGMLVKRVLEWTRKIKS